MYVKSLEVRDDNSLIREVTFHAGINLIVDETSSSENDSGNNVGKTTALRLIDMCLGGDEKKIYADPANTKNTYEEIESYLKDSHVSVKLTLVDSLDKETISVVIERTFGWSLQDEQFVVNGEVCSKTRFNDVLKEKIFPSFIEPKPGFRSIISHNSRFEDNKLSSVHKTLDPHTSDLDYSALYCFLFGVGGDISRSRSRINAKLKLENANKSYLRKNVNKKALQKEYDAICDKISVLLRRKDSLFVNDEINLDSQKLYRLQARIREQADALAEDKLQVKLIESSTSAVKEEEFKEDLTEIRRIYAQANAFIPDLHEKFERLVDFHNVMLHKKVEFIQKELPELKRRVKDEEERMRQYRLQERTLKYKISNSVTMSEMKALQNQLNELSVRKGVLSAMLRQILEANQKVNALKQERDKLVKMKSSQDEFQSLKDKLAKFNELFSQLTKQICLHESTFSCKEAKTQQGVPYYAFNVSGHAYSTGNKLSEIFCFDLAYTIFANVEQIPCLHFLLNDRKELVDHNQLLQMAKLAQENNTQLILSILSNKVPNELKNDENIVLKLSQKEKFFKRP